MTADLKLVSYDTIRPLMQMGDNIFMGGNGMASAVVKLATGSPVSHIAAVFITLDNRVQVIESTQIGCFTGVTINYLSDRIANYDGKMWWAPLCDEVRDALSESKYMSWMRSHQGKDYDLPQAIGSALDVFPFIENKEDFDKLFCSELVTGALEFATEGRIPRLHGVNASKQTPRDCYLQNWHAADYYQFLGPATPIPGFS